MGFVIDIAVRRHTGPSPNERVVAAVARAREAEPMTTAALTTKPARTFRLERALLLAIVGGLLGLVVLRVISYAMQPEAVFGLLTQSDHKVFVDAAERIRSGGPIYRDWQLSGPYSVLDLADLYPPPVYILIVAASFVPDVLWWAVPLGILVGQVWYQKPSLVGWAAILACFAPPWAWDGILSGGAFMWVAAFVALGTRWPVFYAGALLKPSLLPFALFGVRSRWWWVAVALAGAVSLAMLPLWFDYLVVLRNMKEASLTYSIHNVPLVLVPLAARFWSTELRTPSSPSVRTSARRTG